MHIIIYSSLTCDIFCKYYSNDKSMSIKELKNKTHKILDFNTNNQYNVKVLQKGRVLKNDVKISCIGGNYTSHQTSDEIMTHRKDYNTAVHAMIKENIKCITATAQQANRNEQQANEVPDRNRNIRIRFNLMNIFWMLLRFSFISFIILMHVTFDRFTIFFIIAFVFFVFGNVDFNQRLNEQFRNFLNRRNNARVQENDVESAESN
ncbi:hypothetical protein A3Q56_07601, partial [Intoshia linei]